MATATRPALTPLASSPYRHEKTSADGLWHYQRLELPGTPWAVTHIESGRWLLLPNLRAARALTASGWVLAELDRREPAPLVGA